MSKLKMDVYGGISLDWQKDEKTKELNKDISLGRCVFGEGCGPQDYEELFGIVSDVVIESPDGTAFAFEADILFGWATFEPRLSIRWLPATETAKASPARVIGPGIDTIGFSPTKPFTGEQWAAFIALDAQYEAVENDVDREPWKLTITTKETE